MPSTNNNKRGRENETEEQRLSRLAKQRTRSDKNRASKDASENQRRLDQNRERNATSRANETQLDTRQCRQHDREHHAQSALQPDMAVVDDGQQDLDVLPSSHRVLLQEGLERAARGADMTVINDGQQDLDVLPPSHRAVLLQEDLERAARGEIPLKPLRMHNSIEQMVTAFLKKQFSQVLHTCTSCSERWWPESLRVNIHT